jgi:hypothetical protein
LWLDHNGNDLLIIVAEGRAKTHDFRQSPNVGVSLVDPNDLYPRRREGEVRVKARIVPEAIAIEPAP